jgi:hypothetical protein
LHLLPLLAALIIALAGAARSEALISGLALPLAENAPAGTTLGALVFRGALELTSSDRRFGGLSGLAVSAEGHATSVSDEGYFAEFDLVEDNAGTLLNVRNGSIETMRDTDGRPFPRKRDRDAEELILLPDGTRLVVFEHNVRFGYFPKGSATATRFVPLPNLVPPTNQGIEAAVLLGENRFLLIAERLGVEDGLRRAWLGRPGAWNALAYVPPTNDDVSGAALLPDGDLLVLERDVTLLTGFRCRLVRVPAKLIRPGALLEGNEILRLAPPFLADNFEGVAVRTERGRVAIYLVSDDNYFALQRTLLLKFELADEPVARRPASR